MPYLLILFGPPGSGKTLLGNALFREEKISKIATGDLLRKEVKDQTPLGIRIAYKVLSGQLVDDDIVNPIVAAGLENCSDSVLLDGYPRNFAQFNFLKQCVDKRFYTVCIHLDISFQDIIKRISQRRICQDCGTTHFADAGKCPYCGGRSVFRSDDAVIVDRLAVYRKTIEPLFNKELIPWCDEVIKVNAVDIDKSIEQVLEFVRSLKHLP